VIHEEDTAAGTTPEVPDDTLDTHYSALERLDSEAVPHGCLGGLVFIGRMVEDAETGEEVEVFEAVPCRRCQGS